MSQYDDTILEKFLGEEEITEADLKKAIRHATIHEGMVPVLTGSAFKNKGVQPLLDAIVDFMPSPLDVPAIEGTNLKGNETLERHPDRQGAVRGAGVEDRRRSRTASSPTSGSTRARSRRAAPS